MRRRSPCASKRSKIERAIAWLRACASCRYGGMSSMASTAGPPSLCGAPVPEKLGLGLGELLRDAVVAGGQRRLDAAPDLALDERQPLAGEPVRIQTEIRERVRELVAALVEQAEHE